MTKLLEKYYSPGDLAGIIGFAPKFWRDLAKAGELTLHDDQGNVLAEPANIAGEFQIPASAVNAYVAKHKLRYDPGIKARNKAELRRKLEKGEPCKNGNNA